MEHLRSIADLQILIRQPSISATNEGLEQCAILLSNMMNSAGIKSELLYLDIADQIQDSITDQIPPVVFGEVKSKSNPNAQTIIFYTPQFSMVFEN